MNSTWIFILFSIIIFTILITFMEIPSLNSILPKNQTKLPIIDGLDRRVASEVLLIYVWANTHSHAYGNLKYFIDNAVRENDGVDYYFILQRVDNKTINESTMPVLPSNGQYLQHDNECFDFGTVGWFFNRFTYGNPWINQSIIGENGMKKFNLQAYRYFILLNSSIRGPFFPPYYLQFLLDYQTETKKIFYWYYVFTKRLNSKIKLTGCTISCLPVPHIQSYILAMDFVGLTILLKPGSGGSSQAEGIFGCYPIKNHVSLNSEVPSSNRILQAGYMIDCLLTKYQGIDFNDGRNYLCNQHRNPYFNDNLNGVQIDPYEVVFIKYSDFEFLHVGRERAKLYQRWMEDAGKENRSKW